MASQIIYDLTQCNFYAGIYLTDIAALTRNSERHNPQSGHIFAGSCRMSIIDKVLVGQRHYRLAAFFYCDGIVHKVLGAAASVPDGANHSIYRL